MPDAWQPEQLLAPTALDPHGEAICFPERSLTWLELETRARQLANQLRGAGLAPGDTFAVLAPNRAEWAELVMANARAGTKYVPLNWHCTVPELIDLLDDSGARVIVTDPQFADAASAAADACGGIRIIVLGAEYEQWLAEGSADILPEGPLGTALQYTGGTTGPSRGVIRPDATGVAGDFRRVHAAWPNLSGMPVEGRAMLVTPAYHALGGAILRSALARGLPLTIVPRWDEVEVLRTIESRRITVTAMVPTQFLRLLKVDPEVRDRIDVSSLAWVLHTAAPCPVWVKEAMIDWFGPVIVELYGSSEGAGPFICTSEEWLGRPGTVGRPVGALEVSIVGEDGSDLPTGEVGMVYVKRGDGVPEYHGDPEKSAAMRLADGRFTVGDLGWVDEDGFLFLADRRVDLIITGGSNVYPAEIEAVISRHERVADVAVFGVPHPEWGQQVMAVVEPVAGSTVDPDEVTELCREHLASFKVPRVIDIVEALPREASGKLKKRALREQYLAAPG